MFLWVMCVQKDHFEWGRRRGKREAQEEISSQQSCRPIMPDIGTEAQKQMKTYFRRARFSARTSKIFRPLERKG